MIFKTTLDKEQKERFKKLDDDLKIYFKRWQRELLDLLFYYTENLKKNK